MGKHQWAWERVQEKHEYEAASITHLEQYLGECEVLQFIQFKLSVLRLKPYSKTL